MNLYQDIKPQIKSNLNDIRLQSAELIMERIIKGEYPVNSLLPREKDFIEILQISRSSLREALWLLASKNVIVTVSGVGSKITPYAQWNLLDPVIIEWLGNAPKINADFITHVLDFQESVAPTVAKMAAKNAIGHNLYEIEKYLQEMQITFDENNLLNFTVADAHFHAAIFKATNNHLWSHFSQLIFTINAHTLFMNHYKVGQKTLQSELQLHYDLYNAIRQQDDETAYNTALQIAKNASDYYHRKIP